MATTILVVDDDSAVLWQLETHLAAAGYEVQTARGGAEALRLFREHQPKIVITDLIMAGVGGLELCREIRSLPSKEFVYILVMSAFSNTTRILEVFDAGANDFLSKPFYQNELLARLHAGMRVLGLEQELARERVEIHKANAELLSLNKKLQQIATTDELTGLPNRREAMRLLNDMWSMATRQNQPLSCMMFDVDNFKSYNDQYGHEAGDAVLRSMANILKSVARTDESVCRLGGEEFLVLCPLSTAQTAAAGAERFRRVVESNKVTHGQTSVAVTISVGVAEKDGTTETAEKLLAHADAALYTAKRTGKNRVCVAGATCELEHAEDGRRLVETSEGHQTPVRVLVVDDDPAMRRLCRELLESMGYSVLEAHNGAEGLELASQVLPEMILMDIEMPKLDGLACIRRLRDNQVTRLIPVVVLSSRSEGSDFEAAVEVGVDDYITKPIKPKEFLYRIQSVWRQHYNQLELIQSNTVRNAQARALGILLDLSRGLASCSNLELALDKIIEAASELTLSHRISIMLPDKTGRFLTVAKSIGLDDDVARSVRLPIGGDVAGRVYLSREPVLINSSDQATVQGEQYGSKFFVSAPLISTALRATDRVVGVLNITERYDSSSFGAVDVEYIDLICNIAASAIDVIESHRARDEAHNAIVVALAQLAEHRDDNTGKHLDRVTQFSLILATELRGKSRYQNEIDDDYLDNLKRAMPLHDIGKVAIPDRVLLKPSGLTVEEMSIMKTHVEFGANTIRSVLAQTDKVPFLKMALDIILGHHEWYNGSGYPHSIKGQQIPLAARIAALADVYDALTSNRPYKSAFSHEKAASMIRANRGSQFDPEVADAFLKREQDFRRLAEDLIDDLPEGADGGNALDGRDHWLANAG